MHRSNACSKAVCPGSLQTCCRCLLGLFFAPHRPPSRNSRDSAARRWRVSMQSVCYLVTCPSGLRCGRMAKMNDPVASFSSRTARPLQASGGCCFGQRETSLHQCTVRYDCLAVTMCLLATVCNTADSYRLPAATRDCLRERTGTREVCNGLDIIGETHKNKWDIVYRDD